MATAKKTRAAPKRSQSTKQSTSSREPGSVQPKQARRAKPGTTGEGDYYHIEVQPASQFTSFRTQDVGDPGGIERVAGKRSSGSWDTQKWLISKQYAHLDNDKLIADTQEAREVLDALGCEPKHIRGDRFVAEPRMNIPESKKPTSAQQSAQRRNIKKAQAARVR